MQLAAMQDEHMVQTFSLQAAHEPLTLGVGFRRPKRRFQLLDAPARGCARCWLAGGQGQDRSPGSASNTANHVVRPLSFRFLFRTSPPQAGHCATCGESGPASTGLPFSFASRIVPRCVVLWWRGERSLADHNLRRHPHYALAGFMPVLLRLSHCIKRYG
jgi:hypothetical protein